jgi:hypothetical protein
MSYSRWSNSSWYTFWNVSSGKKRSEQVLSAWYSLDTCIDWTYAEIESLFKDGIAMAEKLLILKYNCNSDEAKELQELMQRWVSDVKEQFSA